VSNKATFGDASEAWGTRSWKGPSNDLDITPMIDVVFQLLIFFMLTSTMQPKIGVDVPIAQHGLENEAPNSTIVFVSAPIGGEGDAILQLPAEEGEFKAVSLDEVVQIVRDAVGDNKTSVIIKAEGRVTNAAVDEVAQAVSSIDGVVLSIGVQQKQSN
jgi:biopolymer transport protein ExbD